MFGWRKEELSKEKILEKINQFDIFYYYIDGFEEVGERFHSELREDQHPSCSISERDGVLFYKDFGDGTTTNCFGYVMRLFGISYWEALTQISVDFDLGLHLEQRTPYREYRGEHHPSRNFTRSHSRKIFKIKRRDWQPNGMDKIYWYDRYGIVASTLDHYQVSPARTVWMNGRIIMTERKGEPIYAYRFAPYTYKFMCPFSEQKWLSNSTKHHVQGYDQLPWIGNLMVITKSLKDVMVLHQLGVPAVAPHSEGELIPSRIMKLLLHRFANVIVLFDDDEKGRWGADRYQENYPSLHKEFVEGAKDISDLVMDQGIEVAKDFVHSHIFAYWDEIDL